MVKESRREYCVAFFLRGKTSGVLRLTRQAAWLRMRRVEFYCRKEITSSFDALRLLGMRRVEFFAGKKIPSSLRRASLAQDEGR
jgi:hypothetical protein